MHARRAFGLTHPSPSMQWRRRKNPIHFASSPLCHGTMEPRVPPESSRAPLFLTKHSPSFLPCCSHPHRHSPYCLSDREVPPCYNLGPHHHLMFLFGRSCVISNYLSFSVPHESDACKSINAEEALRLGIDETVEGAVGELESIYSRIQDLVCSLFFQTILKEHTIRTLAVMNESVAKKKMITSETMGAIRDPTWTLMRKSKYSDSQMGKVMAIAETDAQELWRKRHNK